MILSKITLPLPYLCAAAVLCVIGTTSCNEDYDLNKIDSTVNLDVNIGLPIGNTELIKIGDFLDLDTEDGNSGISINENGDFGLSFSGEGNPASVSVPAITINPGALTTGGFTAEVPDIKNTIIVELRKLYPELPPDVPDNIKIPADKITVPSFKFKGADTPLLIENDLPAEIIDIQYIEMDAPIKIAMQLDGGSAFLEGIRLVFPEFIHLSSDANSGDYSVKDGHIIEFGSKVEVSGTPYIITLNMDKIDFTKIPDGQGLIDGKLHIDDNIRLDAFDIDVNIGEFETVGDLPESITLDIDLDIKDVKVSEVSVKVDPEIAIDDQTVELGEMPEFITGDNVVLDIYNPAITLEVTNQSPLTAYLDADIKASGRNGKDDIIVHIGDAEGAYPDRKVEIRPEATTRIYLSKTGEGAPSGAVSIVIPELGDLISSIPEKITISDIDAKADKSGYIEVGIGEKYEFSFKYSIDTPLAFGEKMSISYSTDDVLKGLNDIFNPEDGGSSMEVDLRNAVIKFDMLNTIPMNMGMTATPIDAEGNELDDVIVDLNAVIKAGNTDSETTAPVVISIAADRKAIKRFDGLRLDISAKAPEKEFLGVALNENQGIRFVDIKVRIEGGIETEL